MSKFYKKQQDEHQKLVSDKTTSNDNDTRSSRLEWAEASWTRCLHILCWWWINPTISTGYKRPLTEDDLDHLPYNDKSSVLLDRLQSYDWNSSSTWVIVIQEFWSEYIWVIFYCFPYLFSRLAQPLLLRQVMMSAMDKDASLFHICTPVMLLCVFGIVQVFFDQQIYLRSMRVGMRIRNVLSTIVYRHSLSIKSAVWQHTNTGQITNLIADHTSKLKEIVVHLHYLWEGPLEATLIFILLCWIIQPISALVGCLVFFLTTIILFLISRYLSQHRDLKVSCSDKRVDALSEFIHGYDIIKMYNWEKPMEDRIKSMRQDELHTMKRAYVARTLNAMPGFALMPILALTTFGIAWLLDHPLNAVDCFTTLALFGLLRSQVIFLMPLLTERLADAQVASKRIDAFMRLATTTTQHLSPPTNTPLHAEHISLYNASFSWSDDRDHQHRCLSSLNITIKQGTLIGIVGASGSGKSSFLAALLGEINLVDGQLDIHHSSFSYAAQSPWIFADTIRNNILLNRPFHEQRYRDVIHASCLDVDLSLFGVSGDLTMIGERVVNLSGGQKTRVSLARALYDDEADVYLIDDPLAAVDATVAKQIYQRCFSSQGLLKLKTRLLVTHQTHLLIDTDQIIFLSHGHIDEQGRLDELINSEDVNDKRETSELDTLINEKPSISDSQPIIVDETSVTGNVNWNVWFNLFTAPPAGLRGFYLLIVLLILGEVFYDGGNYWLSIWLKQSNADQQQFPTFAYVYFGLAIATIVADLFRTILFFSIILHGTNHLHNNMLKGLLYTSIQFFESNPSGRIISRASDDQKTIDDILPVVLLRALKSSLMALGSLVIMCLIKPYILLVVAALVPLFLLLCRFYLRSKSQLKRLESITRSPIYDHLLSSLRGAVTVRVFNVQDHFIQLFTDRIDRNTRAYINMQGAARWFDLRLNLLPVINTFATAMILIVFRNDIDSSSIALCLMYAISIPKAFQLAVLLLFQSDILMTSAERIHEYAQLPSEEDYGGQKRLIVTSPDWPAHGTLQFQDYSLCHRSGLEPTLKNINLNIKSTEKIGIIGRTGAGKSSLFKGILRFIHRTNIQGQIFIDDVDISRITLHHLRSQLSIIPQHPILFQGTLRYNLDPFHVYSDEQCWMALDDVQLKHFVHKHPDGLDMIIGHSGGSLSAGQCQLICIARAILKKSLILLVDEATSNVDHKTDQIIQTVITNKFQDRTVLTIAHRLNTIAKSDRILVLDKGSVVNFDTPVNILQQYQYSNR